MTRVLAGLTLSVLVLVPSLAGAQSANPWMDSVKAQATLVKSALLKTAEIVPETLYAFRPTPEVRTLGEIIGHVADANLSICGVAGGEKAVPLNAEKTLKTKAELAKALADSFAFCDKIIAGMDDKKGGEVIKFMTGPTTRGMVLGFNNTHDYEHYGNLVTYMRINKIVPPSSAGQ